jgi:hypothetical protein
MGSCRPLLATMSAAGALALGACGVGPGEPPSRGVELRVTRDFGQDLLHTAHRDRVRPGDTIIRLLQSERRVETGAAGGSVQSIGGLRGRGASGRRAWFYFVNGLEGDVAAAQRRLYPGDVVQWDYRRGAGAMSVPAIVGAFPEPFRSGVEGKRLPVRLECVEERSRACREVHGRLAGAGVNASLASFGEPGGAGVLRVVVGPWSRVRRGAAAAKLEQGPRASGVFVRFAGAGTRFDLLDAGGRRVRTAQPGTGLVAATGDQRVWFVTGLDAAGVERAAAALDRTKLRDRYAVAVQLEGIVALPLIEKRAR